MSNVPNNPNELDLQVPHGLLGMPRHLRISGNTLSYTGAKWFSGMAYEWLLSEVAGVRYSHQLLVFYRFRFGNSYTIELRHQTGELLRIRMYSFDADEDDEDWNRYEQILAALEAPVFERLEEQAMRSIEAGETVLLAGVAVNHLGLSWAVDQQLTWTDCDLLQTPQSFTLNSRHNSRLFTTISYQREWNAGVLLSVIQTMLKNQAA
ncbi:hypothetical protein [Solirubrum puertoriconensis]|uniref:Uncharacterized protein n=1 Tax=Solirubrum puertoriconensis TaxID=1751427 RepID=A0A9X0HKG5_SOLP1|nr:hypothetical protein [Solirubrum puertoriconensis]KUG07533.1 hypothetical protein ASU33_14435 [Solirubrum puertoriconensis]